MEYFCLEVNWAFIIALIALIVAVSSNLNQLKSIITAQLHEKAKEANSFTNNMPLNRIPESIDLPTSINKDSIGGILHAIDSAELIIRHWQKESIWFGMLNKQGLIDIFYIQLNLIVIENVKDNHNFYRYLQNYKEKKPDSEKQKRLNEELVRVQNFLEKSRKNYVELYS